MFDGNVCDQIRLLLAAKGTIGTLEVFDLRNVRGRMEVKILLYVEG